MLQEISAAGVNTLMLIVTAVVAAVVGSLAMFLMPLRIRLAIMVALAIPQVILPGVIESASVFQLWVAACGIVSLIREKPKFPSVYGKLLAALAVTALIATLWSPLTNIALIAAMQIISFLVIAVHAAYVLQEDSRGLIFVFRLLSVGVLLEAILVVTFRLRPEVEFAFLQTQGARILIGTEKLNNFFAGSPDNVFDPEKAGGLWLNANTASMFLGIAACTFMVAFKRYGSRWFLLTAAIAAFSIIFAGSKTGLLLLVIIPVIAYVTPWLLRAKGRAWILPAAMVAYPAFLAVQSLVDSLLPAKFSEDSAMSLGTRSVIWDVAGQLFTANPVLGLGYGGWGANFFAYSGGALGRSFPPHNIVIAVWSDSGLVGACVLIAFMVAVVVGHVRRIASTPSALSAAWGWSLAAFIWTWTHGMADAVTFYGDIRTVTILGLLTAFLLHEPRNVLKNTLERDTASLGRPVPNLSL